MNAAVHFRNRKIQRLPRVLAKPLVWHRLVLFHLFRGVYASAPVSFFVLRKNGLRRIARRPDVRQQPLLRDRIVAFEIAQSTDRLGEGLGGSFEMIEKSGSLRTTHRDALLLDRMIPAATETFRKSGPHLNHRRFRFPTMLAYSKIPALLQRRVQRRGIAGGRRSAERARIRVGESLAAIFAIAPAINLLRLRNGKIEGAEGASPIPRVRKIPKTRVKTL
jgi:hypothetical protein